MKGVIADSKTPFVTDKCYVCGSCKFKRLYIVDHYQIQIRLPHYKGSAKVNLHLKNVERRKKSIIKQENTRA